MNTEFEFTMILDSSTRLTDEVAESIYERLKDCTISHRSGIGYLQFAREGARLDDAILSAIKDVCDLGLKVRRIDVCSLVTQAEIARRAGLTRQAVNNYATGIRNGGFPAPICHIHDDHAPLWNWCEVAQWLAENNLVAEPMLDDAFTIEIINTHLDRQFQKSTRGDALRKIEESLDECESCG